MPFIGKKRRTCPKNQDIIYQLDLHSISWLLDDLGHQLFRGLVLFFKDNNGLSGYALGV